MVPGAAGGRRAVRPDQHRRRRRGPGPGTGAGSGRHRRRHAGRPQPDHVLVHAGGLPAAATGTGRTRRGDPAVADRELSFPTSIGTSDEKQIRLLGQDLAADLMGKVGFGELALWLVTGRRPSPGETRVFEAVLVALADHGFTPTAIAARLTYLSAPESLQGALAAGLLGGGSRFLGVTEDCGMFLSGVLHELTELPADDAGFDALALQAVTRARAEKRFVPGLGHPVHK